ncbi:hypothetical protein Tdes44962_MAKER09614, partial [Teratosphaeria destructans]
PAPVLSPATPHGRLRLARGVILPAVLLALAIAGAYALVSISVASSSSSSDNPTPTTTTRAWPGPVQAVYRAERVAGEGIAWQVVVERAES